MLNDLKSPFGEAVTKPVMESSRGSSGGQRWTPIDLASLQINYGCPHIVFRIVPCSSVFSCKEGFDKC